MRPGRARSSRSGRASASSPRRCCAAAPTSPPSSSTDRLAAHLAERFDGRAGSRPRRGRRPRRRRATTSWRAPWALVANVPYHITSPILHHVARHRAAPGALRAHGPARGRRADRGATGRDELPLGLRAVPRRRPRRLRRAGDRLRARSGGRLGRARGSHPAAPPRRRDARSELWRLVQAGFRERRKMLHNVLARQLRGPRLASASTPPWRPAPSRRTADPRRCRVEEWLALRAALSPAAGVPT